MPKMVIQILFIFLLLTSVKNSMFAQLKMVHHKVEPGNCSSYVLIEGSTNINNFTFFQYFDDKAKEQFIFVEKSEKLIVQIPANKFEASNPMMHDDFLELIKADLYPKINILIYYNPKELTYPYNKEILSKIIVKLAGTENNYTIQAKLFVCKDQNIRINGSVKLNLMDFHLKPPVKFLGMVKVNKEVLVNFGIILPNSLLTKN